MRIVKLHENFNYIDDCCSLLNQEWPRSVTARLHSLSQSNDSFPMCLCLLDDDESLIGHVKINREPNGTAFIESLIITEARRGQGLGRFFMTSIEDILRSMNFSRVFLSTIDKLPFYEKLGYSVADKVKDCRSIIVNQQSEPTINLVNPITPSLGQLLPPPPPPLPSLPRSIVKKEKILMIKSL